MTIISSEPGDHPLPHLLLCSSIFQMKNIWVSLCVGPTISFYFLCLFNLWRILLAFCQSNLLVDDVMGYISNPNVLSSCMVGFWRYREKRDEVLSNAMWSLHLWTSSNVSGAQCHFLHVYYLQEGLILLCCVWFCWLFYSYHWVIMHHHQ